MKHFYTKDSTYITHYLKSSILLSSNLKLRFYLGSCCALYSIHKNVKMALYNEKLNNWELHNDNYIEFQIIFCPFKVFYKKRKLFPVNIYLHSIISRELKKEKKYVQYSVLSWIYWEKNCLQKLWKKDRSFKKLQVRSRKILTKIYKLCWRENALIW